MRENNDSIIQWLHDSGLTWAVYEHDTIAGVGTPPGQGGIAVIRISGPHAEAVARQVFVPAPLRVRLLSHRLYFGQVIDPLTSQPLDQGVLALLRAPRS